MSIPTTDREVKRIFRNKYKDRPEIAKDLIALYQAFRASSPVNEAYTLTLESQIVMLEESILRWKDEIEREKGE